MRKEYYMFRDAKVGDQVIFQPRHGEWKLIEVTKVSQEVVQAGGNSYTRSYGAERGGSACIYPATADNIERMHSHNAADQAKVALTIGAKHDPQPPSSPAHYP